MGMLLISLASILFKVTNQKSMPTWSFYWKECFGLVPQNGRHAVAINGHMTCDISVDSPIMDIFAAMHCGIVKGHH